MPKSKKRSAAKAPAKSKRKSVKKTSSGPVKVVAAITAVRSEVTTVPPANTNLDTLYIINASNNDVTLEVNVGAEGQTSDMTIKLNDAVIVENHDGDFEKKSIGSNKELNGKKLSIVATITDTSGETNLTSLTIHLRGGVSPADFPLSKTVDNDGESADYLCLI